MAPYFLTVEEVIKIQEDQIHQYGGSHGIRDRGLLESAVAQAEASFGGEFLHKDLFEMAAAYLYHLVENHPFIDGNKRAGTATALVFLEVNRIELDSALDDIRTSGRTGLEEIVLNVIAKKISKQSLAEELRRHWKK